MRQHKSERDQDTGALLFLTIDYDDPATANPQKTITTHDAAGKQVGQVTEAMTAEDQADVQAFNDEQAADVLPGAIAEKLAELQAEFLARIGAVFPALQSIDDVDLVAEVWKSLASLGPVATPKLQSGIDLYTTAKQARGAIAALTDPAVVQAYDVTTDPGWAA